MGGIELLMVGARPAEALSAYLLATMALRSTCGSLLVDVADAEAAGARMGRWIALIRTRRLTAPALFRANGSIAAEIACLGESAEREAAQLRDVALEDAVAFAVGKLAQFAERRHLDGFTIRIDDGSQAEIRIVVRRRGVTSRVRLGARLVVSWLMCRLCSRPSQRADPPETLIGTPARGSSHRGADRPDPASAGKAAMRCKHCDDANDVVS